MTGKPVAEETSEDWDERFRGGWQKAGGSYQSLLFAFNALRVLWQEIHSLAEWQIEGDNVSAPKIVVHDYGCALGDGTALLQAALPVARVIGVDFSEEGICRAQERWPTLSFKVGDITHPEDADIIWTSHTLEHVEDPSAAVALLLKHCKSLVVVVPYIVPEMHGGHEGSPATQEWVSKCPKPLTKDCYMTFRKTSDHEGIPESNVLLVWKGNLNKGA